MSRALGCFPAQRRGLDAPTGVEGFRPQFVADAQRVGLGDRLPGGPHDDAGVRLQAESGLEFLSAAEEANRLLFGDVHGASVRPLTVNVNTLTKGPRSVHAMRKSLMDRARFARLRAGFRLPQDAAEAIGCSRPLVLSWENGSAKSIGGKFLLAVAKAYRVDPAWLTLEADADGFPYEPAEPVSPPSESGTVSADSAKLPRLDPVTLRMALDLLAFDEDQAGAYSPMRQAARLSEIYSRVAADGGVRLSDEANNQFDDEVRARARHQQQGKTEPHGIKTPTKPGRHRNNG